MTGYLDLFPKVRYDLLGGPYTNYEVLTNLTFRFGFIQKVLNNISAYTLYSIKDGDTPEIIAEHAYGDPEAHWIIILANNIRDPQYDWPLDDRSFKKYLINKYGSIANSKNTIHHYEKVIQRVDSTNPETVHETRFEINFNTLTDAFINLTDVTGDFDIGETVSTNNSLFSANVVSWTNANGLLQLTNTEGTIVRYQTISGANANGTIADIVYPTVPFEYYLSLPETLEHNVYNLEDRTITEDIFREAISNYQYELAQNESKRLIKVIKKEYYTQIQEEFDRLTRNVRNPTIRTLR